jgi:outer membrane usher protein FimD/PapC
MRLSASVSRNLVDNLLSDEDSDLTAFNTNITWQARRNLTIRADGNYDEDTGGTVLRSNTRWKVTAQWRYRRISLRMDTQYRRQRQGDLDNDNFEFWVQIRRELF